MIGYYIIRHNDENVYIYSISHAGPHKITDVCGIV